jgi:hypothetical protein
VLRSVVMDGVQDIGQLAETAILYPSTTVFVDKSSILAMGRSTPISDWLQFFEDHRDSLKLAAFYSDIWPTEWDSHFGRQYVGGLNFDVSEDDEPWHKLLDKYGAIPHPDGESEYQAVVNPEFARRFVELCQWERHALPMLTDLLDQPGRTRNLVATFLDSAHLRQTAEIPSSLAPVRLDFEDIRPLDVYRTAAFAVRLQRSYGVETSRALMNATRSYMRMAAALPIFVRHGEDYQGTALHSAATQALVGGAIVRHSNLSEADIFREVALKGADIRSWVNGQERPFLAFRQLYEAGTKFRKWISELDANEEFLAEYLREISRSTRFRSVPSRVVRWASFTAPGVALDLAGAGGLGTAAGVAVSLLDTFVLDQVAKGWRPNHFTDEVKRRAASPTR